MNSDYYPAGIPDFIKKIEELGLMKCLRKYKLTSDTKKTRYKTLSFIFL